MTVENTVSERLPLGRMILNLAIPSILAGITIPLVGMVDTAVAGRLGSAAHLGAIAIGSMLFNWLYWNMGFLRMGTAGLTAQAYGRQDWTECINVWVQGMLTALAVSLLVLILQRPYAELFFLLVPTSPEVETMAREYFYIRIWAAPAALSLFAVRGWFIGMQNTWAAMFIDFVVNGLNIVFSIYLGLHCQMGVSGIALGTVIAQYSGLLFGLLIMFLRYGHLRKLIDFKRVLQIERLKSFFTLNANLFVRSICMLLVYTGVTYLASSFGDTHLAVATIMMQLLLLYSYFVDGFAYAGEALTGRFIGAGDPINLRRTIARLFIWCAIISVASTLMYIFWSDSLLHLLTSNPSIIQAAEPSIPWLYIMPVFSCIAFTWDGIFIGATASKSLRNTMLWSVASFYIVYFLCRQSIGFQALWLAYFAHLLARSLYQTLYYFRHHRKLA